MRTIEQQTGWKRSHPKAICQDLDALEKVTEFSYDLNDRGFVDYYERRTGEMITKCDPKFWPDPAQWWSAVMFNFANPAVPAPDSSWAITRAKLQDCWELYAA